MATTISQQMTHANENLRDGWVSAASTWTYASASTITVPSGAASIYQKGDRLKFTQTTVKYAVVVGVADTVLTIAVNTDYTVANAAISANYYSHQANPLGYPNWFAYTATFTSQGGAITGATISQALNFSAIAGELKVEGRITLTNVGSGSPVSDLLVTYPGNITSLDANGSGCGRETVNTGKGLALNEVSSKIGMRIYDNSLIFSNGNSMNFCWITRF